MAGLTIRLILMASHKKQLGILILRLYICTSDICKETFHSRKLDYLNLTIDHLKSGGLLTNFDCTSKCSQCRHKGSPHRSKGFVSKEQMQNILQKLEELNCKSIHLEGGEPFLYPEELIQIVKQIEDSNISLEHIVTNCSWYRNQADAKRILKTLRQHGVQRILLKVGPFQNESIPLKKVQNVAKIAEQVGMNVMLWDSEFYPDVAQFDASKTHNLKKYVKHFGENYIKKVASKYSITMAGRSFDVYQEHLNKQSLSHILSNNKTCLNEYATHTHFHFDKLGNFSFSHTQGVTIQIDDLGKPLDWTKYPFLHILYTEGINGIYKLAVQEYGFKAKSSYLSKCHLCYEIRRHIVANCGIDSPDLQPREFYLSN